MRSDTCTSWSAKWTYPLSHLLRRVRPRNEAAVTVPRLGGLLVVPEERVHFVAYGTVAGAEEGETITFVVVIKNETDVDLYDATVIARRLTNGHMDDLTYDTDLTVTQGRLTRLEAGTGCAVLAATYRIRARDLSSADSVIASFAFVAQDGEGRLYRDENDAIVVSPRRRNFPHRAASV